MDWDYSKLLQWENGTILHTRVQKLSYFNSIKPNFSQSILNNFYLCRKKAINDSDGFLDETFLFSMLIILLQNISNVCSYFGIIAIIVLLLYGDVFSEWFDMPYWWWKICQKFIKITCSFLEFKLAYFIFPPFKKRNLLKTRVCKLKIVEKILIWCLDIFALFLFFVLGLKWFRFQLSINIKSIYCSSCQKAWYWESV